MRAHWCCLLMSANSCNTARWGEGEGGEGLAAVLLVLFNALWTISKYEVHNMAGYLPPHHGGNY